MTFKQIISELKKLGDKDKIVLKEKKFGIIANNSLGIYHNDLKELAKLIDKDNQLAIKLFDPAGRTVDGAWCARSGRRCARRRG